MTLLMIAVLLDKLDTVRALLRAGAEVLERNDQRSTALHLACSVWDPSQSILLLLLRAGADPHGKDQDGHTPLELVTTERNHRGRVEQIMREAGAFDEEPVTATILMVAAAVHAVFRVLAAAAAPTTTVT